MFGKRDQLARYSRSVGGLCTILCVSISCSFSSRQITFCILSTRKARAHACACTCSPAPAPALGSLSCATVCRCVPHLHPADDPFCSIHTGANQARCVPASSQVQGWRLAGVGPHPQGEPSLAQSLGAFFCQCLYPCCMERAAGSGCAWWGGCVACDEKSRCNAGPRPYWIDVSSRHASHIFATATTFLHRKHPLQVEFLHFVTMHTVAIL